MKRTIIGSLVGAIIMFICQFLSWGIINLHEPAQKYTPNEAAIMAALNANLTEDGGYFIPNSPPGASSEEMEKLMNDMKGKPWAIIEYHKAYNGNMVMSMVRQFLVNIIIVWLFCWLITNFNIRSFGNIFLASLALGLIVFLNAPYTLSIWYHKFDTMAHFADAIICWALVGLWLGFYYNRRPTV